MDERRVVDYFVVAGLPENPMPLEEFSNEAVLKPTHKQDPISDIAVINKTLGEKVPNHYTCVERTTTGHPADLNSGSLRSPELYLCYRRSRDKPALTDIGVLYEGKERLMDGCKIVHTTLGGNPANVNNSNNSRIYITYRRAADTAASDTLAVVDVCIILTNKGETPPHAYCQINKNLNKGMMGSDVFICYKKAMTKSDVLAYKPEILARYPEEDYECFPLPASVPLFCLPMGASIECWPAKAQHPLPVFSTFILTGKSGGKVFGAAVAFYEEFPNDKLSDLQMRHLGLKNKHIREQYRILKTVHANKCICLLSHWPFFDAFKKFLSYLYKISITGPHTVPIERHISHFMYDVPYPAPQRPRILIQLNHEAISLSMPEESPLPQSGASFITLLKNMGPENCLHVLLAVLTEHKILIHSLRPAVLTGVAEAVSTMIFPLHWQCPYIPLCPLGLSDVLNAPVPYIVGIDSRYFDLYDPPTEVICIDLDTNNIWLSDDKRNINIKILPKKPTRVLSDTLHRLFHEVCQQPGHYHDEISLEMGSIDYDFKKKKQEVMMELAIQEAFLRFTACVLKGYKNFLKPITEAPTMRATDATALFDMQGFLRSRDKTNSKFYSHIIKTQMFIRFIEERSFVSDKDASLAFFDECTEKVDETRDDPKLIELDDTQKSDRTVFITPPEPIGLPEGVKYKYNGFPELKPELFLQKKPPTLMLPGKQAFVPNSPLAKRTNQEKRSAHKMAQQQATSPEMWAKCLLGHCYSLWFIHLPSYIQSNQSKDQGLRTAFEVLKQMQLSKAQLPDEVCYRVLLQLCGQYNQPMLAVKVLFEMRRNGINPNAVTYGFYNKAVLESTWPSPNSRAMILWKKVRNVILGVAQFRRNIRRRSVSICSESDFDQISRTSIDSYMEDIAERPEPKSQIIANAVNVADPPSNQGSSEERGSTGGASDRGYNSMTQEDAKKLSQVISTSDLDQVDKAVKNKVKKDHRNSLRLSFRRKHKKMDQGAGDAVPSDPLAFHSHNVQDHFLHGSIVRKSLGSIGSTGSFETLQGSLSGSAAGLLMLSQSSLDHSVFLADKSWTNGILVSDSNRKRHRSAGDYHTVKGRSNSLFSALKQRHNSIEDSFSMRYADLALKENQIDNVDDEKLTMSDNVKVDSGVELGEGQYTDPLSTTMEENETSITPEQSGSPQLSLSPQPSLSTPVTENDPLGVFTSMENGLDKDKSSATVSPKHSTNPDTSTPYEAQIVRKGGGIDSRFVKRLFGLNSPNCNGDGDDVSVNSIEVDMHSDPLSPVSEGVGRRLKELGRTSSSPDCLQVIDGNGKKSAVWPLKGEQSTASPQKQSSLSLDESEKSYTERYFQQLVRSQSLKRANESLSGAFKFAASAVASKFTELKLSMSASGKLGSEMSIDESDSDDDSDENYNGSSNGRRKYPYSKSFDELNRTGVDHHDGNRPSSNRNGGTFGSAPSPSYLDHYTPHKADKSNISLGSFNETLNDIAMEMEISSCCRCPHCHFLLYDEEIMAGWTADDSNLNTNCTFCITPFVPHLQVYVKDWRAKKQSILVNGERKLSDTYESNDSLNDDSSILANEQSSCGDNIPSNSSNKDRANEQVSCEDNIPSNSSNKDSKQKDVTIPNKTLSKTPSRARTIAAPARQHQIPNAFSPSSGATGPISMVDPSMAATRPTDMGDFKFERRRCTSECMTTATDSLSNNSSVDSAEHFNQRLLRSPLNISIDEELPTRPASVPEMKKDIMSRSTLNVAPLNIAYLSPIVLRKELENIVESEGDMCLADPEFVDEHPIIFWNLVWYFKRIDVPSHVPGSLLKAKSTNSNQEDLSASDNYDSRHVLIRPLWDNIRLHEEAGYPMYLMWNVDRKSTTVDALVTESQVVTKAVMHMIITSIQCNDVLKPIKLVMNARRRHRQRKSRYRSMYREILYLVFVECGRASIDHDAFDREYKKAFSNLSVGEVNRMQRDDLPRSSKVIWCRKVFEEIEV